jgi:uncharacterized Zn-binding protein involved in type VI secretion
MGFPAARLTDMHVCPMVTGIVPHVGGPITGPGCPTVLIQALPAARVSDMCTCVGPPDLIAKGSSGVFIGGMPAARMLDTCAHGGMIVLGCFTVLIGEAGGGGSGGGGGGGGGLGIGGPAHAVPGTAPVSTGLGNDVDTLANQSPTLQNNIRALQQNGWTIQYGPAGGGSYTSRDTKTIVVDQNEQGNATAVAQTLAHESGHAMYTPDPYVPPNGLTRDQYIQQNTNHDLKDEGEATMTNVQVRNEILGNGGPDIGVAGAQSDQYQQIAAQNAGPGQRDTARQAIGDAFADGEHPSTSPGQTYRQYYGQTYADYWDQHVAPGHP